MKLAVLNASVPFLRGGAEYLADSLVAQLVMRGHEVEHVKIPMRWASPLDVAESMFAAASLEIPEADMVIALKFPAYLVPHPNKVIWLLHQFRQAYDLWGTDLQDIPTTSAGRALRASIRKADDRAFEESRAIYCNSTVTAARLSHFNGFEAPVLLAPHNDVASFKSGPYGDYLLAIGRVTAAKRQHLLVEAMSVTASALRLVVAGQPETPADLTVLQELIDRFDLSDRVELLPRYITDMEKVDLISGARAVAYLPVDEDSYGYVTAEAMYSAKPVLSASDSGGVLELVRDGVTGLIAEPNAESLAVKIDLLSSDIAGVERMGMAAQAAVHGLDLSWDATIERLLA
ncbi:glycosyltransferase family 4 protein [Nakamurella lactea]|uniref:glycosyltransferase family 4 protein n=1 Tax=Nakamurella lactea TaxID=459515 RepID=UPI0004908B6A|nr:glycosyltransferase family 4 protein [Nakamurella lactea]